MRAALRNLHQAYGTWECLAEVMGVSFERVDQTWPKGVPLDGTGELRVVA